MSDDRDVAPEGDRLGRYRSMRDFEATPEPAGDPSEPSDHARFVVQEHHATSLHWDLRLERDGVLVSFALPKGIPPDPRQNHLAVHTEDHPMEYLDFAGGIPEGSYGAGAMWIWDRGTYTTDKFDDREVMVTFDGEKTRGRYVLFRTGGNQWMIHRMDPPEDPTRELMPEGFGLMEAVTGELPSTGAAWAFEFEWPGARFAVAVDGGRCRATDAAGKDVTATWPELAPFGRAIGSLPVALDAVAVTLGTDGRPDTARLARRRGASASGVRRMARDAPATVFVVDLLWLDGHPSTGLPYRDRRRLLVGLGLDGPHWRTPLHHDGDGGAVLAAAGQQGLPGVIAKTGDSQYVAGVSELWVRVPATPDKDR